MIKRKTIEDFLSGGESHEYLIEADKKGNPRVVKKQRKFSCGCDKDHVCPVCYDPGKTETDIENNIVEYCESLPRCKCIKTPTKGRRVGNKWIKAKKSERKGKGDLIACYWGFYIEIEVKKPGEGRQGEDQKTEQNETLKALGEYWLVDTLEEFIQLLKQFGQNKGFIKN